MSEYGKQLLEKQKLRTIYGVMERQFRNYFHQARRSRERTGEALLSLLERRLDNIVYRLGFAPTLPAARQLVVHGHILLNDRKVDIPSHLVKAGDTVAVREKSRAMPLIRASLEQQSGVPEYLSRDQEELSGRLLRAPQRDEIPVEIDESLIVEFYSR